MVELFANSGDPEQTPYSATSDLGLRCVPVILLRVSRLQWVNTIIGTCPKFRVDVCLCGFDIPVIELETFVLNILLIYCFKQF